MGDGATRSWTGAESSDTDAATRVMGAEEEVRLPAASAGAQDSAAQIKERLLSGTGGHIGRFVVLRELGEGGMGVVFAAYDPELDRKAAIKLLRSLRGEGSIGRGRLLREAQALARLSHPNVVTIYEVGEFERQVFLAMEFVQGPTLLEWLREAPRDRAAILRVFVEAGRGLAAAHAAEILHRDFKPANVLLGADGRVRVADFGLAQAQDRREIERDASASGNETAPGWTGSFSLGTLTAPLTVAGQIVGTPSYMAPERFISGAPVDARADQFSFCVALHEALYGVRPFAGKTFGELREAVLSGEIVAPPREAKVPAWLRKVVLRGLSRDPEARFPSMLELLAAIERDPVRARRRWLAGAGAAALLVAGGYALAHAGGPPQEPSCQDARPLLAPVWDDRRADVERALLATQASFAADTWERVAGGLDRWADAWAAAHLDACRSHLRGEQSAALLDLRMVCLQRRRGELSALVDRLAQADAATVIAAVSAIDELTPLARCSDAAALTAAIPPPEDPQAAARVAALRDRIAEARAAGSTRKHADGLAIAREVVAEAQALAYRPLLAEALAARGFLEDGSGDYEAARATWTEALWLADACRDDVLLAKVMGELVSLLGNRQAKFEEALRWRPHADAVVLRVGEATASHAGLLMAFGTALYRQGRTNEALPLLEQALAISVQVHGPEERKLLAPLSGLGNVRFLAGDAEAAKQLYRRALAIGERVYGPQHPEVASIVGNLGTAHASLGEFTEAKALFERALAIDEAALGPDHPEVSVMLGNLGALLSQQNELKRARELLARSIAIDEPALGPDHPDLAGGLYNLGLLDADLGDRAGARALLRRSLAIRERAIAPDHPLVAEVLAEIGRIELEDGEVKAAAATLERALVIVEKAREGHFPELEPRVRFNLARALRAGGKHRRAEALAREALVRYRAIDAERFAASIGEIEAWLAARR